ncbi:MAG: hypothetical protein ACD_75C01631G0003, partial [uncultured bacterium]
MGIGPAEGNLVGLGLFVKIDRMAEVIMDMAVGDLRRHGPDLDEYIQLIMSCREAEMVKIEGHPHIGPVDPADLAG